MLHADLANITLATISRYSPWRGWEHLSVSTLKNIGRLYGLSTTSFRRAFPYKRTYGMPILSVHAVSPSHFTTHAGQYQTLNFVRACMRSIRWSLGAARAVQKRVAEMFRSSILPGGNTLRHPSFDLPRVAINKCALCGSR